jgi:3-oxoacyl-[acyl-carrier-protein] synthase-3
VQAECEIQGRVLALDVSQGCSGFVQALVVLVSILKDRQHGLIVCADTYRSKISPGDRSTSAVFSDGASATWISKDGNLSILGEEHFSDGSGAKYLNQPIVTDRKPGKLHMSGSDVLLFTRNQVSKQIASVIAESGVKPDDIESYYFHQASKVVLDGLENKFNIGMRMKRNIEEYGNLVSSSIPILMAPYLEKVNGEVSMLSGFGVGLSASTLLIGPRLEG